MSPILKPSGCKASIRRSAVCIWIMFVLFVCNTAAGQGWVAEVSVIVEHDLYAYERLDQFRITYSGVTATGQSEFGWAQIKFPGNTPLTGDITLSVWGTAWDPHDVSNPGTQSISGTLRGNHAAPCETAFFEAPGSANGSRITLAIRLHPRMEISQFHQQCGQLTLTANPCVTSYVWEVSESISDGFRKIPGKSSSSITLTHDELAALNFSSPYGRKYFRVTGLEHTTSQLQPIDVYYPGPSASMETTQPKCNGASDGVLIVDIASALPSVIDDFVLTLYDPSGAPLGQDDIIDANRFVLDDLRAGSYRVRIENNTQIGMYGNCWAEDTLTLTDPSPVEVSSATVSDYNGFQVSCSGAADGVITINPAGGTGAYVSYEWTSGVSTTQVANDLPEGTYQVRVKDSNQCWSDRYSYSLAAPDKLKASLLSTGGKNGFDVSCHDKADGQIQTDVTGGIQPYNHTWTDGAGTATRNDLGRGSYSVTVSDANQCVASETITLVAPDPITFSIAEIQGITCKGDYSGILEVQSINNAIGEISTSWSTGESGLQISDKSADLYQAIVRDAQGCSTAMSYELKDPPAYTAELKVTSDYHGSAISCNRAGDGVLTATLRDDQGNLMAGDHYAWYGNGMELKSQAGQVSAGGLSAGFYKVEVMYRTICKAESTAVLNEPDVVVPMITTVSDYNGMPITCAGKTDGHLRALATGGTGSGYDFVWNTGTTGADLDNIGAGTFRLTASDINGCIGTAEKTIVGPDSLKTRISIVSDYNGEPISCAGRSDARLKAIPRGGTAPHNFTWSSGETEQALTDVPAGDYVVTTVDANGCSHVTDTIVTAPLPVVATIGETSQYNGFGVSCYGASDGYLLAVGTGGTGTYTYRWQSSDNTRAFHANLKAGEYQAIIADQNNCSDTVGATLIEPAPLVVKILDFRDVSCSAGDDGQITLRAEGGASGYAYSLDNAWQESAVFDDLAANTYSPVVRDANKCTTTTTQLITEPSPIQIHFNAIEPALCGDPRGRISSQISGGTGDYILEWKDADNEIIGSESVISGLTPGVFALRVLDDKLCEATASAGVPSSDGPTVDRVETSPASCSYSADGEALIEVQGNAPFTFRWPDGQATNAPTGLSSGQYLVEVTDSDGCLTVVPITISSPDSLRIEVVGTTVPTCNGDCNGAIRLTAHGGTGGYEYKWADSSGPMLDGICAGTYSVTVSDEHQCESTLTVELDDPRPIETSLIALKTPTCPFECDAHIEVSASGGTGALDYRWSNGGTQSSIDGICAGEYSVVITDSNQCTETSHFALQEPEGPSLDLGGSVLLCAGQTHLLDPGPMWAGYKWESDYGMVSFERRLTVVQPGTYWVEVIDGSGCIARDTFLLNTSDDLLAANFLLTTEAFTLDTIVAIDISWPLPSGIRWSFPDEMLRLGNFGDIVYGQFQDPGLYQITLSASLGECRDQLTKSVNIIEENDRQDDSGKLGHESFVREFTVYPNPNDGRFDVVASFLEETPIVLTLLDLFTSRIIAQIERSGSRDYTLRFDLMSMSAGAYSLRLDHRQGTTYRRIIIK